MGFSLEEGSRWVELMYPSGLDPIKIQVINEKLKQYEKKKLNSNYFQFFYIEQKKKPKTNLGQIT